MTRPALKAVPDAREERIDVTALIRADIRQRDWAAVHVAADRRPFVAWADAPKRIWAR